MSDLNNTFHTKHILKQTLIAIIFQCFHLNNELDLLVLFSLKMFVHFPDQFCCHGLCCFVMFCLGFLLRFLCVIIHSSQVRHLVCNFSKMIIDSRPHLVALTVSPLHETKNGMTYKITVCFLISKMFGVTLLLLESSRVGKKII